MATATAQLDRAAWTYPSGLASALEGRLLTERATLDLLQSESPQGLILRLRQSLVFEELAEAVEPFELAERMTECHVGLVREFAEACPTELLAELFLLPIEWQAFRGFLRERVLGGERTSAPGSSMPEAVWEECWRTPDLEAPFDLFAEAADVIRSLAEREEQDSRLVEGFTHIYEARDLRRTARQLACPKVLEWVEAWLRLRLALAVLRCRFNGWGHVRAADALDDLGVAKQRIMTLAGPQRPNWPEAFVALGLPGAEAVAGQDPRAAVAIERLIDDHMSDLVREGRGVPFGPEPVFGFLWGVRVEALNLRLIATGLAAGVPADHLAEDVRKSYAV